MFQFGIPTTRTTRVEKYPDTAVLTIESTPAELGKGYKFNLNPKAVEVLALNFDEDAYVSFAFQENALYIANTTDVEGLNPRSQYRVGKTNHSFSNKPAHQYIEKHNLLGFNGEELDLQLVAVDGGFQLTRIVEENETPVQEESVQTQVEEVNEMFVANVPNEPIASDIFA